MGYAVYEDSDARWKGVMRWAGYGVPAVCDNPECNREINRGLGYKCETRYIEDEETGEEYEEECCGLYFCGEHLQVYGDEAHDGFTPKSDTSEWEQHVLTDDSWARWRAENPARVAEMEARR